MSKAILFSQRRWDNSLNPAHDTIEKYKEDLKNQDSVLWPQWKIGKHAASENIPFQHKDIRIGYIHSSKFRKGVDKKNKKYLGKVGHKIRIEWIKDGNELTSNDRKCLMRAEKKPLYDFNNESFKEYFTAKVFWMKVTEIEEIKPPIEDTKFINYSTNENLKRPPIQYAFVNEI